MTTTTAHRRGWRTLAVPIALGLATVAPVTGHAEAQEDDTAGCVPGDHTTVTDVMDASDWDPITPEKWTFTGEEIVLHEAGSPQPGPRRPFELATLTTGPEFGDVRIDAEVRLDTPVSISNRDVIVVFGYQSPTRYYYAHLSQDNTIYPHNGIFRVDDADRFRIDDQWDPDASRGAPPAVTDADWHAVQVRHCPDTGAIEVYVDGAAEPLMTATDTTFDHGRVGFGSFDNIGRLRDLVVTGDPTAPTTKDDCKNGGWEVFTAPSFRNQGRCVATVNAAD